MPKNLEKTSYQMSPADLPVVAVRWLQVREEVQLASRNVLLHSEALFFGTRFLLHVEEGSSDIMVVAVQICTSA